MITSLKASKATVTRFGTPETCTLVHQLFLDIRDRQSGEVIGQSESLGVAVQLEGGHILYAQPDQLVPA